MENKKFKTHTSAEMTDKYIGKLGTPERDAFEYELRMELISDMLKKARQERQLTQEELGKLVGVQKAQISKLENRTTSASVDTIIKVFKALRAEITFSVKMEGQTLSLT